MSTERKGPHLSCATGMQLCMLYHNVMLEVANQQNVLSQFSFSLSKAVPVDDCDIRVPVQCRFNNWNVPSKC